MPARGLLTEAMLTGIIAEVEGGREGGREGGSEDMTSISLVFAVNSHLLTFDLKSLSSSSSQDSQSTAHVGENDYHMGGMRGN